MLSVLGFGVAAPPLRRVSPANLVPYASPLQQTFHPSRCRNRRVRIGVSTAPHHDRLQLFGRRLHVVPSNRPLRRRYHPTCSTSSRHGQDEQNPEPVRLVLDVSNMRCGNCVTRVERTATEALANVYGDVAEVAAQFADKTAIVTLFGHRTQATVDMCLATVLEALRAAGFPAALRQSSSAQHSITDTRSPVDHYGARKAAVDAGPIVLAIALSFMARYACCGGFGGLILASRTAQLLSLLILSAVAAFPGREILASGVKSMFVRHAWRSISMDTLVTLSVVSQFCLSLFGLVSGVIPPRFHECVLLLGFVRLGRVLEDTLRSRALQSCTVVASLSASDVFYRRASDSGPDGASFDKVSRESIRPGDVFRVRVGEQFPVDGHLLGDGLSGQTLGAVDASLITGESLPVKVGAGDYVVGGSLNVGNIPLLMRSSSSASDSEVSMAMRSVSLALAKKSDVHRLGDVAATALGQIAIVVALTSLAVFCFVPAAKMYAASRVGPAAPVLIAGAVLASACPCGFAIAVPMIMLIGSAAAARLGIFFKDAMALERAGRPFKLVALDKTGTLTTGRLSVSSVEISPKQSNVFSSNGLLQILCAIEEQVGHPIADAVCRRAKKVQAKTFANVSAFNVQEVPGCGVSSMVGYKFGTQQHTDEFYVGSYDWISSMAIGSRPPFAPGSETTQVLVYSKRKDEVIAALSLSDEVRCTPSTASSLRRIGGQLAVLSGDSQSATESVAQEVGISRALGDVIRGELRPSTKLQMIEQLGCPGGRDACVVGDGVNDGPMLAAASLGVAMGRPSERGSIVDVPAAAASVAIPRGNVSLVCEAIQIGRMCRIACVAALTWAFLYNCGALLATSGALLWVGTNGVFVRAHQAAVSMVGSSAVVLLIAISLAIVLEGRRRRISAETL